MDQRASLLGAGLVGIALATLVILATGWLAGLAIPGPILNGLGRHSHLLFVFDSVVMIDLPVTVLSYTVGVILFRSLHRATPRLALICAAPWVLYVGCVMIRAFLDMPHLTKQILTFSLVSWSALFAVPAGLLLATLSRRRWPFDSRLERTPEE